MFETATSLLMWDTENKSLDKGIFWLIQDFTVDEEYH